MNTAVIMIVCQEARERCRGEPNLEERCRKAFLAVQDAWLTTDDDTRFRAALAAIALETTAADERDRLIKSVEGLRTLKAMASGVPVDIEEALAHLASFTPIPLLNLWYEAKVRAAN